MTGLSLTNTSPYYLHTTPFFQVVWLADGAPKEIRSRRRAPAGGEKPTALAAVEQNATRARKVRFQEGGPARRGERKRIRDKE